jgi:thiaminase/transcriptional activator TenA
MVEAAVSDSPAMPFTEHLWQASAAIYDAIMDLPFNVELTAGMLDPDTFRFYIVQDSLYLVEFARALAITGARSEAPQQVLDFLHFAEGAIVVERSLHEHYFAEFGVRPGAAQSPACAFYTNYLLATAAHRSYEEAVAALLPCFWIYREVGHAIHRQARPDNPYQRWIDTYAGEEFAASVDRAIAATEAAGALASETARNRMVDAFITSSRLEWMFWDSAYRREAWPP